MFCPKCGSQNQDTNKFCKKCGRQLPARAHGVSQSFSMPHSSGLLGQTLDGKYRIEAKLGSGGMGDVYRATRLLIGDQVAVKILHPHLAVDPQAAERFRREAVMATKLRHRNVVGIYDVGISAAHNVPYILMELAEGFTLRQIINQYRLLPLDFAVTVTTQVCSALEEAHNLGIVHRDIKPENIVANETTSGWYIKVLDFGIAKLYNQGDIGLTQDGNAMGTPQYMSPEQCMGESLDARSDIYGVGILLYEMLAGSVPFRSPTASAVAVHQVQTPPPPPRNLNPDLHPDVERLILKALSKAPSDRQPKASQLAKELIDAATYAFKSGFAVVATTPVTAPDITPDFNPVEEGPTVASASSANEAVEDGAGTAVFDSPDASEVEYGEDRYVETKSAPDIDLTELDIGQAVSSTPVESGNDADMDHARDAVLTDPDPSITASGEGPVAELEDSENVIVNVAELSNAASVLQDTNDTGVPENALETVPDREIIPEKAAILTDATPTDLAERDETSIDNSLETESAPALVDESEIINQEEAHDPSTLDEPTVPEPPIFDTQIEDEKDVASDRKSTIPRRRGKRTERPIERPKEDLDAALASSDTDLSDSAVSKVKATRKPKKSGRTTVPGRGKKFIQSASNVDSSDDDARGSIAPSALDKKKDVSFDQQDEQLASIKPDPLVEENEHARYDEDSSESHVANPDLTAVFEDAELRLDEILVDSRAPTERAEAETIVKDDSGFARSDSIVEDGGVSSLVKEIISADEPPLPAFAVASPQASSSTLLFAVGGVGLLLLLLVSTGAAIGWMYFYSGIGFSIDQHDDSPVITDPATNAPPGMAYVPGGEFIMGSDDGDIASRPAHLVKVDPFYMDITEVTNAEYKKFIDATGYREPEDWKNRDFPKGQGKYPVTNVNWDDANSYAEWAGKRLPSEAEWEFAARGTDGRKYPWGEEWDKNKVNAGPKKGITAVGKHPGASPFGMLDMVGNAWEWTSSDYAAYPGGKIDDSIKGWKVIRGGSYESNANQATTTFRNGYPGRDFENGEEYKYSGTSFRCVQSVPKPSP